MILSHSQAAVSCRRNATWLASAGMLMLLAHGFTVAHAEPVKLTLTDANGRAMIGVVCDNLEGLSQAERTYLVVGNFAGIESYKLLTSNGTQADAAARNNVGEVRFENGQLRYYPPAEFNYQQAPFRGGMPITHNAQRSVELQVTGHNQQGQRVEGIAKILLSRPTVVLVHGINNTPEHWNGTNDNGVGSELRRYGFTVARLNHGKTAYQELLEKARKHGKAPVNEDFRKLFFRGNGPVEFAAGRLCETVQVALKKRHKQGFAARRVDIVAHSYGGVISRWYLRSNALHSAAGEETGHASRLWYTNSNYPGGKDLYDLPPSFLEGLPFKSGLSATDQCPIDHTHSVRKLITIASPWRGVPVANLVNETHGPVDPAPPDAPEAVSLRRKRIGLKRLGWYINNAIPVPVRVPAMEVLAVNSRWLGHLNARPFVDGIAYGAVAGNDNAYQLGIDLNTALDRILSPSWFVYFGLEHRPRSAINYSDGLVPVWSAVIGEESRVIPATHNKILWHPEAKRYVLEALSRSDLTRGATLNERWSGDWQFSMPLSKAKFKTWHFKPGHMAPGDRDAVYALRLTADAQSEVARISQQALRELRAVEVRYMGEAPLRDGEERDRQHFVSIAWTTTVPTLRPRVIFHGEAAREVEVITSTLKPSQPQTRHEIVVRGLRLNTPYKFTVQSEIENPPDRPLRLSSRAQSFTLKQGEVGNVERRTSNFQR